MSLLSSIGNFLKPVVGVVKNVGQQLLGGITSSFASGLMPAQPSATTAGTSAGGLLQTIAGPGALRGGGIAQTAGMPGTTIPSNLPMKLGAPTPQGLATRIGAAAGNLLQGAIAGTAGGGVARMKRGRLTGNAIPAGYVEKMSPAGVVYLGKVRRRRGISGRDLSAYRRVDRLVHKIARSHSARRK